MATKQELLDQARAAGVDVDESATKAEIEAALDQAGVNAGNGGVLTRDAIEGARPPETGPSDTSKPVKLTAPDGTKVTVEERLVERLKSQGYK
jgi:post-segregation antitoxin (ccd killing protein)